jgi:membrane protein
MVHQSVAKLKKIQARAEAFWSEKEIAFQDEAELTPLSRFAHFWVLVIKSFGRNRCPMRAGALAYTTLLALIPLLAVAVGISTALLKKEGPSLVPELIDKLVKNVAPQLGLVAESSDGKRVDQQKEAANHINEYIRNVNSSTLGVTGVIGLIMAALLLFTTVEETFNDIWGISRGRSWASRLVKYWAGITLVPLLLVAVFALTTGPHFKQTKAFMDRFPLFGAVLYSVVPFVIVSLVFVFFYRFLPNAKIDWEAAFAGGVVGGSLWQMNNVFSVLFVSRIITYRAIYQSIAIVPIFMFGLYLSWLILLFGAQVAYAYQHRRTYVQEKQAQNVNQRGREFVAFRLMAFIGRKFQAGERGPTVAALAAALGAPSRLIGQVLEVLVQDRLLLAVAGPDTEYAPARPLASLTCADILKAMRAGVGPKLTTKEEPILDLIQGECEKIERAEMQVASSITLQSLVCLSSSRRQN